MKIEETPPNTN